MGTGERKSLALPVDGGRGTAVLHPMVMPRGEARHNPRGLLRPPAVLERRALPDLGEVFGEDGNLNGVRNLAILLVAVHGSNKLVADPNLRAATAPARRDKYDPRVPEELS